jgi:hypothetical protein
MENTEGLLMDKRQMKKIIKAEVAVFLLNTVSADRGFRWESIKSKTMDRYPSKAQRERLKDVIYELHKEEFREFY